MLKYVIKQRYKYVTLGYRTREHENTYTSNWGGMREQQLTYNSYYVYNRRYLVQ